MAGVLVSACVGSKPCGGFSCKGYYKLIAIQINMVYLSRFDFGY
nr:MAG TPA: hypothetical protein [Bacteriophage sp.]